MFSSFAKTAICLLACLLAWTGGILWFVGQIPVAAAEVPAAEAIVALTGGKGRLEYGFALLAEGKGTALFISGAGRTVTREDILLRVPTEIRDQIRTLPDSSIAWGSGAENTIGNALETERWIKEHQFQNILLVTSNYHMPRAILEFNKMMPGLTIIPAPVFSSDFRLDSWWRRNSERTLILSEYHKLLAGKLRHWFLTLSSLMREK